MNSSGILPAMQKEAVVIFTDGASRGNPGPGGWGAVVAVGDSVRELGGREDKTTNNRMELMAILEGLRALPSDVVDVSLYTDSTYAMKGATQWMKSWQRTHWQTKAGTPVSNRDIWEQIADVLKGKKVTWNIVAGHAGIPGNERCDVIATTFADNKTYALYRGHRGDYDVDLEKVTYDKTERVKKDRSKHKAYSYLSLLDGITKRHETWASCESRIKGARGAKYRKSISINDELEILKDWGVESRDVIDVYEDE